MIPKPALLVLALLAILGVTLPGVRAGVAAGNQSSCPCFADDDFGFRLHHHHRPAQAVPRLVGQEALGSVQEVVGLLMADPNTDWSQVRIARLRDHLLDLNELMLHAEVEEREVPGGLAIRATGTGRTLAAIRRLVPSHARRMDGFLSWRITVLEGDAEVRLTIEAQDPEEVERVRALGFFGLMAAGVHRPHELLAVARGTLE